jgi:hypothetical protein
MIGRRTQRMFPSSSRRKANPVIRWMAHKDNSHLSSWYIYICSTSTSAHFAPYLGRIYSVCVPCTRHTLLTTGVVVGTCHGDILSAASTRLVDPPYPGGGGPPNPGGGGKGTPGGNPGGRKPGGAPGIPGGANGTGGLANAGGPAAGRKKL